MSVINKLVLAICLIFFLGLNCIIKPALAQELSFSSLTIEDGLSQNTVNCIVQDSRGFMWFGTQDGLNSYDGYAFT